MAIVVGLLVGYAVRKGSNGRGGWRYQALAMFLTYTSIVSSYVPLIFKEIYEQRQTAAAGDTTATDMASPAIADSASGAATEITEVSADSTDSAAEPGFVVALLLFIGIIYALPFLAGIENIVGLIIIGIGLYEAWKLNQRVTLAISGPYQVGM